MAPRLAGGVCCGAAGLGRRRFDVGADNLSPRHRSLELQDCALDRYRRAVLGDLDVGRHASPVARHRRAGLAICRRLHAHHERRVCRVRHGARSRRPWRGIRIMKVIATVLAALMLSIGSEAALLAQVSEAPPPPRPAVERPPAPVKPSQRAVPTPPPPVEVPEPAPVEPQEFEQIRYTRPAFRLWSPYVLAAGKESGDVTVIMSDATIEGHVDGDLVVVMGNLRIGRTAVIDGSVVNVIGSTTVEQGASVNRDLVIVAAAYEAPSGFTPGGEHVIVNPPILGNGLRSAMPWFTSGLLWGRVIVPSLPWVWYIVALSLLVSLALAVAFPQGVWACTETLAEPPVGSFVVGILTLLLVGPVSTILAISVVGLVVIPFALCAMFAGWMLGKVSVAQWIGGGIVRQDDPEDRSQIIRSVLIGFAIICVAYMI